ncbi:short-chain dehydrogenase [Streptomonospora alba]|uniref:Short-chain dehydrogenase n=1 Tax=Streptomonospora alba TaxID=183763 RepID=A0A0C2JFQ2_9ACTN|nr:SDR family NAD(P)-dependent oxidoreductase [Streptomonospora alba]KIH97660.1 short-chain dehydrogenase [Streptomonospora alba]
MSESSGTSSSTTTALITGGNKGLGYEAARRLGELGWRVFLGARDEARGRTAAQHLAADGADVTFVQLDVTSDDSVAAAVRTVGASTDRLDVLINNAGITGEPVSPEETLPQHLIPAFGVNVLGPIRVTHAFLPLLRAGHDPRVVMVSSGVGSLTITTDPERMESTVSHLIYPASKAALNMITTQYAKAIKEIRFNIADPGYTATDLNGHRGTQTVAEGTDAIVELATASPGRTGQYRDRDGAVPW